MNDAALKLQCSTEAAFAWQEAHKAGYPGLPPQDEQIHSHPRNLFLPPEFLSKTASTAEYARLSTLLIELHELNELFVGENTKDVEAYLAITGQDLNLRGGLMKWVATYLQSRLEKPNPRDHRDPFETYLRVVAELARVFREHHLRSNTINYMLLDYVQDYAEWFVYDATWRKRLRRDNDGMLYVEYKPVRGQWAVEYMAALLQKQGWQRETLPNFLKAADPVLKDVCYQNADQAPTETLSTRLRELADDFQQLRPFVGPGSGQDLSVCLADGSRLVWHWCFRNGIAYISWVTDDGNGRLIDPAYSDLYVFCDHQGMLVDPFMPWVTIGNVDPVLATNALQLNYRMLTMFHEHFLALFDQLDWASMETRARDKSASESLTDEEFATVVSSPEKAAPGAEIETEPEGTARKRPRLRGIRIPRLERILRKLGCKSRIDSGEWKVSRPGFKTAVVGNHGSNVEIGYVQLRLVLRRVGIPEHEFLSELNA